MIYKEGAIRISLYTVRHIVGHDLLIPERNVHIQVLVVGVVVVLPGFFPS